jgi:hypothetical protein
VSDLASGRSDCSHDSQFARAFRHQGSQSKKNADHRDQHGDRSQDIRYGKGLIEDLKDTCPKLAISVNREFAFRAETFAELFCDGLGVCVLF